MNLPRELCLRRLRAEAAGETADSGGQREQLTEEAESAEARASLDMPNFLGSERASDEFRLRQARPLELGEHDDRQLEPNLHGVRKRSER